MRCLVDIWLSISICSISDCCLLNATFHLLHCYRMKTSSFKVLCWNPNPKGNDVKRSSLGSRAAMDKINPLVKYAHKTSLFLLPCEQTLARGSMNQKTRSCQTLHMLAIWSCFFPAYGLVKNFSFCCIQTKYFIFDSDCLTMPRHSF